MSLSSLLRRLGLGLAILVAVVVAGLAGFVAFLHGGRGEDWAAARVERAVPGLKLAELAVTWPLNLSAKQVTLADDKGIWLRIEQPVLEWHPTRLLRRVLEIDRFEASRAVVHRMPEYEGGGQGQGAPPRLSFHVDQLAVPVILEQPVLGERVELNLVGTYQKQAGGGAVDLLVRARQGASLRLVGTAGTDFVDLRWYADFPRLAQWQRLLGLDVEGRLSGDGLVSGRLPSPVITGALRVDGARVGAWGAQTLDLTARAIPRQGGWQAALDATIRQPRRQGEAPLVPEARLTSAFDVDPAGRRVRIGQARLLSGGNEARLSGIVGAWGRQAELRLAVDADRLEDLPGDLSGTASATAQVSGDLLAPAITAIVNLDASRLATGIAVLDRLLGAAPRAHGIVALRGERVRLLSAEIEGARAQASGSGEVWPRLDLHARLEMPDLSVLDDSVKGAGVARGRVAGDYDALATWGIADLDRLVAAGAPPTDGRVGFDFSLSLSGPPVGTVSGLVDFGGRPLEGSARVATGTPTRIENLRLTSRGSRLTGDLAFGERLAGRLRVVVPSLAEWRREIGRPVAGALEAEAVLDTKTIRLTLRGRGLTAEGVTLDTLAARAEGEPSAFRFDAQGSGRGAVLALGGNARIEGPRGLAAIDRMRLMAMGRE
ncbi:MAG TPA: hypothetical protein VLL76_01330, partial [Candidatus Omnitrophota bacterium]|nr:hypothetical protein [Candidatus Omnitrophota bacterium]